MGACASLALALPLSDQRIEHARKALGSRCGPMLVLISYGYSKAQHDKLEAFLSRLSQKLRVAVELRDVGWHKQVSPPFRSPR